MLTIITPPAAVSGDVSFVQSVLDHLRVFADLDATPVVSPDDLQYIRTLIDTAVAHIDGPHGIGRCLVEQTWKLTLDDFMPDIFLIGPAMSVDSIRYQDTVGTWQTMDVAAYRLVGKSSWRPEICPAYGTNWPATRGDRETVEIIFTAGYGELTDVPPPILQAVRLTVAHWYVERQPIAFITPSEIPMSAKALLSPFRVYR